MSSTFVVAVLSLTKAAQYILAYRFLFSRKVKNWYLLGFVVVPMLICALFHSVNPGLLSYLWIWIIFPFMMQGSLKDRPGIIGQIFLVLMCSEEFVATGIELIEMLTMWRWPIGNVGLVFEDISVIVSLVFIKGIISGRMALQRKVGKIVDSNLHIFVSVTTFMLLGGLAYLRYLQNLFLEGKKGLPVLIMCMASYVCLWTVCGFAIYSKNMNVRLDNLLRQERLTKDMQKFYYECLLKKEEDTRRFRHDILNHMYCIRDLIEEGKMEKAIAYFDSLEYDLAVIRNMNYETGNDTLNSITNFMLNGASFLSDVKISGCFPNECDVDDSLLCTIYSNLMKNALEELEKVKGERNLFIDFQEGSKYLCIIMKNSISEESVKKKNLFRSTKKEKKDHGFGIKNIYEALERCNGSVTYTKENDMFVAKVLFKKM